MLTNNSLFKVVFNTQVNIFNKPVIKYYQPLTVINCMNKNN